MFYVYADGELLYYPLDTTRAIISPKLTLEVGKAGAFEFSMPTTNQYYGSLKKLSTIITVELDDAEIFRGRILSESRNFNNIKKIYCEGSLSYLVDSVQKGEAFEGTTHELFRKIISAHNSRVEESKQFTVGDIEIDDRSIILTGTSDDILNESSGEDVEESDASEQPGAGVVESDAEESDTAETEYEPIPDYDYEQIAVNSIVNEWKTSYDYISTCLIETCGGYLRTRREGNTTYIDYLLDYGGTAVQEIEFGVNMLDLTEEVSAEDLFTVLIPLGDDNLTIESVNGGSDELIDANAVATYGRIIRTHVFDNVTEPSTLLENGQRYLATNVNIPITITVRAVDMHLLNPDIQEIHIGDAVSVNSSPHSIVQNLTCTKIEYDLDNAGNNIYTFGNPTQSLTERYRQDKVKTNSNGSGGGKTSVGNSGAAAGAAANAVAVVANTAVDNANTKTMQELQKFYDAWVDYDEDEAKVSLGALSRIFTDAKGVLLTQVGIDLDGKTGNVNINSMKQWTDEAGRVIEEHTNKLRLYHTDMENGFELASTRMTTIEGTERDHYAGISGRVSDLESEIVLKATHEALNHLTGVVGQNTASITAFADETSSRINLLTQTVNDNNASITLRADELSSYIFANAEHFNLMATKAEMAGVSERLDAFKNHLTTKVGISWDAEAGYVNIYSLSNLVDQQGREIGTNRANIETHSDEFQAFVRAQAQSWDAAGSRTAALELKANENSANAKLYVKRIDGLDTVLNDTRRILQQEAGIYMDVSPGSGSNINMRAFYQEYNHTKEEVDGVKQSVNDNVMSIAEVSSHADRNGANVTILADRTDSLTKETASIKLSVSSLGSRIDLKADTLVVESDINQIHSRITHLMGEQFVIDAITTRCKELIADSIRVNGTISAYLGRMEVSLKAPNIHATNIMTLKGKNVATEEYATNMAAQAIALVKENGYATEAWVNNQNFVTNYGPTIRDLYVNGTLRKDGWDVATENYVDTKGFATMSWVGKYYVTNYGPTINDLYVNGTLRKDGWDVATENYVDTKGFATMSWVGKYYLTQANAASTYVGKNGATLNYPTINDLYVNGRCWLDGKPIATQAWVWENCVMK